MGTTSTIDPVMRAFNKHLATCDQCRKAVEDWLAKRDPTPEEMKARMDFCAEGRRVLGSLFN